MSGSIRDCGGAVKKSNSNPDRFLDFPEQLTSHILSLMPTKDAVRTSILSNDWKFKWTSLRVVHIDDKVSNGHQNSSSLRKIGTLPMSIVVGFVERVLNLPHDIKSFNLKLSSPKSYDPDHVAAWISDISMSNFESLIVDMEGNNKIVVLPRSLLRNTSLKNLELKLHCTFKVPSRISFPNLKTLNLHCVHIINELSCSDTLTLSLPVLDTFVLNYFEFFNVKIVELLAPRLNSFHRTFPLISQTERTDYSIKITSMRLVEFMFSGPMPEKYAFVGQQVVCATLSYNKSLYYNVIETIGIQAQVLLNVFSNLKELIISGYLTQVIAQSTTGVSLPVLHHLERLSVSSHRFYSKGLLRLLHKTPFLKFLKIDSRIVDDYYNVVECLPLCFNDHQEEIRFENFDAGSRAQLNLVNFLLENGNALKNFYVVWYSPRIKSLRGDMPELSNFSKFSNVLTFLVNEENEKNTKPVLQLHA